MIKSKNFGFSEKSHYFGFSEKSQNIGFFQIKSQIFEFKSKYWTFSTVLLIKLYCNPICSMAPQTLFFYGGLQYYSYDVMVKPNLHSYTPLLADTLWIRIVIFLAARAALYRTMSVGR